jgi:hypothetical protein
VIIPEDKTDEFNAYVHAFGFSCYVRREGFCKDNVFEFFEDASIPMLKAVVEAFSLN